jgi:hypothetical protein
MDEMAVSLHCGYKGILRLQKKLRPEAWYEMYLTADTLSWRGGNVFSLSSCFCVLVHANLLCSQTHPLADP